MEIYSKRIFFLGRSCLFSVIVLLVDPHLIQVDAWTTSILGRRPASVTSTGSNPLSLPRCRIICRISNIFGGSSSSAKNSMPSLPKDVKEAVSKCRAATQEALKNRQSRMDIEFPVGTKFNVEPQPKNKPKRRTAGIQDGTPTIDELQRSDRELARLFVDMFQPVGGDQITVVFNDIDAASVARQKWKDDPTAACRIVSLDRRKSMAKKKAASVKNLGFAAKLAREMGDQDRTGDQVISGPFKLPENCQVALFVAPTRKELVMVEKVCQEVGMATLVILLNARISLYQNFGSEAAQNLFTKEFEQVFHLAAAPQEAAPNCLLYRAFPGPWVLARKPAVGQPKPILTTNLRPTVEECQQAFTQLDLSPMEKNAEAALKNLASWFT